MSDTTTAPIVLRRRSESARRRRIPVNLLCELRSGSNSVLGRVRDLNVDGCLVTTSVPFPLCDTFELTIRLPKGAPVSLRADVRWAASGRPDGRVALGCRLIHGSDTQARLESLLRDLLRRPAAQVGGPLLRVTPRPGSGPTMTFATEGLARLFTQDSPR